MIGSRRLWIFLLSVVVLSAFFLGEPDLAWGRLRLSSAGLWAGFGMALRALCITIAFTSTIGALSVTEMSRLFEQMGLKGLGFALGVAMNLTTTLGETVSVTYHTCRLRGAWRRRWLANGRRFLIGTFSNALRYGDDVVLAAAARAFDPERPAGNSLRPSAADGALSLALAGLGALLLFA